MADVVEFIDYFEGVFEKARDLENKKIVSEFQKKDKLAKDDRGAWVDMLADKVVNEGKMEEGPPEMDIQENDIMNEIISREINKVWE